MHAASIASLAFLFVAPAFAASPPAPGSIAASVTAARILSVASDDEARLDRVPDKPSDGNDARLAALRSAMDGMAIVEPDDVMALRGALRHGAKASPAINAALRRLDAVEARAMARVAAAVTGPTPVRLDAAPTDLPALVTASR